MYINCATGAIELLLKLTPDRLFKPTEPGLSGGKDGVRNFNLKLNAAFVTTCNSSVHATWNKRVRTNVLMGNMTNVITTRYLLPKSSRSSHDSRKYPT